MTKNKLLSLLLLITFLKGLVWSILIPPFQAPDEQNHFAYLQLVSEKNLIPNIPYENNISQELILATEYLNFDWKGSHPMWNKNTALNSQIIKEKINNIPRTFRQEFIRRSGIEKYSPLYYIITSPIYKVFYSFNLLDRLFFSRFSSIFFALVAVYAAFKISHSITVATLVSFHPSLTFIASTLNNDSMTVAVSSLAILAIINQKAIKAIIWSLLSTLTRIQLGILIIFSLVLSLIKILKLRKKLLNTITIIGIGSFFILFSLNFSSLTQIVSHPQKFPYEKAVYRIQQTTGFTTYIEVIDFLGNLIHKNNTGTAVSLFLKENYKHYLNEVFPWYWGVFGWLEITLPPICYTLLKILTMIAILGLVKNIKIFKQTKYKIAFFLIIFLAFPIILYNFVTFTKDGVDIGVQGRHFLPAVSLHITLLLLGLKAWVVKKYEHLGEFLLVLGMVALNFLSLVKIADYFYGFENTIEKISALKPSFLQPNLILTAIFVYIFTILLYLKKLWQFKT